MASMTGWTKKPMGNRDRYERTSGGFEVIKADDGRWLAYRDGKLVPGDRKTHTLAMSLCEQVVETERRAAARAKAEGLPPEPQISIAVYPTRYGTEGVRVTFDWPEGRLENANALREQMTRTLADIYAAAAEMDGCPSLGQPEIDGLNLMGGNRLRAVMRFETDGGTPAEAETLSDIIHDAVSAPGSEG